MANHTPQEFLDTVLSQAPAGSYLEFRAIGGSGRARRTFRRVDNLREVEIPDPGEANLVFGVLPRMRASGRARDVSLGTCLWIDLDGPANRPWKHPPTAVIQTSPGKSQAYWVLREPLADLELLENLNRRLAQYYGGDPNCVDRARVMRMPGYRNMKRANRPMARVLSLVPERTYSTRTLNRWLPHLRPTGDGGSWTPVQPQNGSLACGRPRIGMTSAEIAIATRCEIWSALGTSVRRGDNLYQCVFHSDDTPSLSIDRDRELFNCFGCGRGGGLAALRMSVLVFNNPGK